MPTPHLPQLYATVPVAFDVDLVSLPLHSTVFYGKERGKHKKEAGKIAVHLSFFSQIYPTRTGPFFSPIIHPRSKILTIHHPSIYSSHNPITAKRTQPFPSRFKRFWFQSPLAAQNSPIFFFHLPNQEIRKISLFLLFPVCSPEFFSSSGF